MRRALAAALLGGVLLGAVLLGWSRRSIPQPAQPPARPPRVSVGLRDGSIVLRHKGAKQAEIRAARVLVSADLRSARFIDIRRAILFDQGTEALHVTAREIRLNRMTNDLTIEGPVVITSSRGYRLTAPEAQWHHDRQLVIFPRGVRVRYGDQEIQAGRLIVDAGLQRFDLSGGVDITFQLEAMRP